ncbi:hypothetical protein HF295_07625 [Hujiaoplasma nucleasis]|uniref:Uncharacterized protein n=1 Tax=Hujiaoplasma nucleasis TaxID=2725268 RepID=A0A7L6N6V5_9MOLU|nr:hypothetical protein [Hujiaoplasma nucleasis]QLY40725.1 hypothetical protein HF295_07625 [Hujiaoplasma nucleasis]
MAKKEYTTILGISISLFLLGFLLLVTSTVLQNSGSVQPWIYNILGFSFFPVCLASLFILLKNRKKIKEYEDNKKMEKGREIVENKDDTLLNLNALLGNTKKYSFIIPLVAGVVLLTLWGVILDLLMGYQLEEFDIYSSLLVIMATGISSFGTYWSYRRRVKYLELYDKDKETLKIELIDIKNNQDKHTRNYDITDINYIDSLLLGLGENLHQTNPEEALLKYLKKTYGLKKYKNLWYFIPPQVFGLIFIIFHGGLSVLNEGNFWFTWIGTNLVFGTIYIMFRLSQREGKYIVENYKQNKKDTIKYLEQRRLVILGISTRFNPQVNTLKYDILIHLIKRVDVNQFE